MSVREHPVVDEELDVRDAASVLLQSNRLTLAERQLRAHPRAHPRYLAVQLRAIDVRDQNFTADSLELGADLARARERTAAQQRLMLPDPCLAALIALEARRGSRP